VNTFLIRRASLPFVLSLLLPIGLIGAENSPRERAAAAIEQALKTDPNNAELWVHLGFAHRKQGQIDQAQTAFEKARSLDPRTKEALYMLGLIYEKKGRKTDAQRAWQDYLAAETDPIKKADAEKHLQELK
jgi:cytochrome c-type biogenesis protein CcmH/NrfG